jgi:hypothetical protein
VSASARVERFCRVCLAEKFHRESSDGPRCATCGTIPNAWETENATTRPPVVLKVGGGSGRGGSRPSLLTTASATPASATPASADLAEARSLEDYDRDPVVARFVCEKAGIEIGESELQMLLLGDSSIPARVWLDDRDRYVIRPHGASVFPGSAVGSLALAQVYASVCARRLIQPKGPSLARWKRRALVECGILPLRGVSLQALPSGAPAHVCAIWDAIALLVAVRRIEDPDESSLPLTRGFVADWSGCAQTAVRSALGWLDSRGYIRRVGEEKSGKPRPTTMWAVAEEPSQ